MNLIEKLRKEHPELDIEKEVEGKCPSDFGLMEDPEKDEDGLCSMICNECWATMRCTSDMFAKRARIQ